MIKLFTHTDLDGIGCAVLAKTAFEGKDNLDIEYCDYDNINERVLEQLNHDNKTFTYIFITDISVNKETAKLLDKRGNVWLLDHHPTALYLNDYSWCTIKIEDEKTHIKTSGTEMYYRWLIDNGYLERNDVLDIFAKTVRDYDTWRWSTLEESGVICKQINDLLNLYGRDKFIRWCLSEIYDGVFPRLYASDELILNVKQKEIDNYVEEKNKQLFTSPMCGKICGYVFAEKYISELGNRLCKIHPEIDFVAMINMASQTVSYRSVKNNIDLGNDIAKLFGGGGHPKAAGSEFSKEVLFKTIKNIFV